MAAAYTLATLRTAILRRLDHGDAGFFTTTWLDEEINNSAQKQHDFLIGVLGQEYALKEVVTATSVGVADHELPSDCYKPVVIQGLTDIGWVPLQRFELQDRVMRTTPGEWPSWLPRAHLMGMSGGTRRLKLDPPPESIWNLRIVYHVSPPVYVEDGDVVGIPFPELLILDVAIKGQQRQRKDAAEWIAERTNLRAEIEATHGPEDRANPPRVIDARRRPAWPCSLKYDASLVTWVDEGLGVAKLRATAYQTIPDAGAANTDVLLLGVEILPRESLSVDEPSAGGVVSSPTSSITTEEAGIFLFSWEALWGGASGTMRTELTRNALVLNNPAALAAAQGAGGVSWSLGKTVALELLAAEVIKLQSYQDSAGTRVLLSTLAGIRIPEDWDCAKVKTKSPQSVQSGAAPALELTSVEFQRGSTVQPTTAAKSISVTVAGKYLAIYEVQTASAAGGVSNTSLKKNGAFLPLPNAIAYQNSTGVNSHSGVALLDLAAGDYIGVDVVQVTGAPQDFTATLTVIAVDADCGKLSMASAQSVADATVTALNLTVQDFVSGSSVRPNTVAKNIAVDEGEYLVIYGFYTSGATGQTSCTVKVNGGTVGLPGLLQHDQASGNDHCFGEALVLKLGAGAVISLEAVQISGGPTSYTADLAVLRLP
jgi:hypothetical protein